METYILKSSLFEVVINNLRGIGYVLNGSNYTLNVTYSILFRNISEGANKCGYNTKMYFFISNEGFKKLSV